jgi:hypothetical protein
MNNLCPQEKLSLSRWEGMAMAARKKTTKMEEGAEAGWRVSEQRCGT